MAKLMLGGVVGLSAMAGLAAIYGVGAVVFAIVFLVGGWLWEEGWVELNQEE